MVAGTPSGRGRASAATDEADFFDRLARAGVKVKLRHSVRDLGEVTAERVTRDAAAALRATTDPAEAAGIARAAADLLTAAAHQWEGNRGGPPKEVAEVFDRAAHDQRIHALRDHVHVTRLRGIAGSSWSAPS